MMKLVANGSFEPEPDDVGALREIEFMEIDERMAEMRHMLNAAFPETVEVVLPNERQHIELPQKIGELLTGYPYRPNIYQIQQN